MSDVTEIAERMKGLREQLDRIVMGQEGVKERLLVGLFAGGHILLEGVPGTGKTLLVLALSRLLGCRFGRIQFTPDLMPTDLLGTNVYNQQTQAFTFHPGPVFTDLLLADEINRTPPKTQSSLLEAMQERAVTIDGERREISPVFAVFATQNPIEFEGTYPLPEAQRDRFLLKVSIAYPSEDAERKMLGAYASGQRLHDETLQNLEPIMTRDEVVETQRWIARTVQVDEKVLNYMLEIVRHTRSDSAVQIGAGPRASLALLETSRVLAALRGRDFVTPDDVKEMAGAVLVHRVVMSPESEMEGVLLDDVLRRIFEKVEVPR